MIKAEVIVVWIQRIIFFGTFVYGLGFVIADKWDAARLSSLYQSMHDVSPAIPAVWGAFAIGAVVLALLPKTKFRPIYAVGHVLGAAVWLYASFIYLQTGYSLVLLTVGLVYLGLWVCSYFVDPKA